MTQRFLVDWTSAGPDGTARGGDGLTAWERATGSRWTPKEPFAEFARRLIAAQAVTKARP